MTDISEHDTGTRSASVFSGLMPSKATERRGGDHAKHAAPKEQSRLMKGLHATVPIVLVGSMAMTMNLTGPIEPANAKRPPKAKLETSDFGSVIRDALSAANARLAPSAAATPTSSASTVSTASAPGTYTVEAGDTVSSIAGRFGLSTASALALNGLSWSSLIFPGQSLKLTNGSTPIAPPVAAPAPSSSRYTIVAGDTISGIAAKFGMSTQTVLSANGLGWSSIIYPGHTLAIPGLESTSVVTPTPAAPAPAPIEAPPASSSSTYLIVSGDTISSIASRFGVSMQSLLEANGLATSSVIFAGRTLTIPGLAPTGSNGTAILSESMAQHARVIIDVGRSLGVPDEGIVIALATAMQESTMRNLDWGDRDSVGLFQQRPSAGWGTVAQLTDPHHAATLFYGGPSNPNAGITRGLLDIPGWQSMTLTQAAQAVQISAFPDAYAKWETSARAWFSQLG